MNPYLTANGRYVLASGIVCLFVGVLLSDGVLLALGEVQIVVLTLGFVLCAPGALVLDRRMVHLDVEPGASSGAGTGHLVGDEVGVTLTIENRSSIGLHDLRVAPFAASGLAVSDTARDSVELGGGQRVVLPFEVAGLRSGRWMLHGFDVSARDPLGLVETRDYLPGNHAFEFYPRAGRLRSRRPLSYRAPPSPSTGGRHVVARLGYGTDIRELRDYQPGDSLRDIAWKQTVRARKLISREFEREVTTDVYLALDISSSMRGGEWPGQKLEYATHLVVDLAEDVLAARDRVGLLTFDEKLYGHVPPGNTVQSFQRMLHHLVGLSSVVDAELTELDEAEVERLAADYLLVQERLDFRKGAEDDSISGVNPRLLRRWLSGVLETNEMRFSSGVLREGVVDAEVTPLREFLQLRGVEIPYRVEARLGLKERGLAEALEHVVRHARVPNWVVVVTDLAGIMNLDAIIRSVRLAQSERHRVQFVVPFTPAFYPRDETDPRYETIRELFTTAEARERDRIVRRLRAADVAVRVIFPADEDVRQRRDTLG